MSRTKAFFKNALTPHFLKTAVFTFALIMVAVPLWANSPKTAATAKTASAAKGKTEVIADDATKTVRIVVDGKDVAVFDSQGLHVQGDIGATGMFNLPIHSGADAPIPPAAASAAPARKP